MKSQVLLLLLVGAFCLFVDGKQLPGNVGGSLNNVSSDVYHQSKIHVIQDTLQPEYYEYKGWTCPEPEDIAPCVCTYTGYIIQYLELNCSAVESEDQLKQIFQADFPVQEFQHFYLMHNSNLKVLESYVFGNISFEIIDIHYSELGVIELDALESCYETVTYLSLYQNKIKSFPFDTLSSFSRLNTFSISDNSLNMIPADAFSGLTTLEFLYIENNTPNIVGTFEYMHNIRGIYLGQNYLSFIPTNFMKTGSSSLVEVRLNDNNIRFVGPDAFDIMEGLKINMKNNLLSTLEEAIWWPLLEAGGILDASSNPLSCGCDVAWLFQDDQLMRQVDEHTTCIDGEYLHHLDPSNFDSC